MKIVVGVKTSYLKIISSLSINCASGILLTLPAVKDINILIGNIIFAILLLVLAVNIEDII